MKRKDRTEFWMLLPSLIILAVISIFPLIHTIYSSFMDYTISSDSPTFTLTKNWVRLFKSEVFWGSWGRTITFAIGGLAVEVILGTCLALLLYQLSKKSGLFLTLLMIPMFVAPVVAGLLGIFLLNSTYGLYAWFLQLVGISTDILGMTTTAMPAIILIDVWEWTPLILLIVLAGLQSIPDDPLEAAEIDGANYLQKLRYVILPLSSQTIFVAALIRSMDILRYVDAIKITTQGGPADSTKVIGYHLLDVAFRFQDFGQASALGLTMIVVTTLLGKAFVKLMAKGEV